MTGSGPGCRSSSSALMGLSMLLYVVLDGYDLGVGLLLHRATTTRRTP
jgi:cytochrome bd-type quinol oxidase subunit 2